MRKWIVIFEAFLTYFAMVSIKITCYYFLILKNRNKHVKPTQKTPKSHVFCTFRGWNLEISKNEFKRSIAFFESFQMPFSDFKNVACIERYWSKTIKMVPSLSHLYFINDWIDQSENLIPKFYEHDLTFISDNFFRYLW